MNDKENKCHKVFICFDQGRRECKFFKSHGIPKSKICIYSDPLHQKARICRCIDARNENNRVKLWSHCVSQHAVLLSPETSFDDLKDYHKHEHNGPCTIRNHEPDDLTYSLKKIGVVLSESEV